MKKCLVADNNMFYLEFFKDVLSTHGYEVVTAADGLIALEIARKEQFDLFLLDYVMPKVDGIRLAKYLREIPYYKETPIILITAAALESVTMSEHESLIDVFVAKAPFDKMKELFNEILPQIDSFKRIEKKGVLGLENIYPRQIVRELLVTELNYSVIFHSLVEGILELDESGIAIFANASFCSIIGKKEHEIIGHSIDEILEFNTNPDLRDAFENLKKHVSLQRESVVTNVGEKTVHFSFYNIILKENKKQGSFVILQDITNIRNKVLQISAIFNITQAFLTNLEYKDVLQYVIYELRRLIGATNISLLFACNGVFKGEKLIAFDRKTKESDKKKIEFWVNKIEEWKKSGLVNVKSFSKLNKVKFDNFPILWLPLIFKETFLGTLIGFKNTNDDFDEEEIRFFEAVGNQLAIYMANEERGIGSDVRPSIEKDTHKVGAAEDVIHKLTFLKWQERNKKNIIKNITERLNSSLATIGACVNVLDEKGVFEHKELGKVCDNISCSYNNLIKLKEDIAVLNKIGLQEESEFHVFNIEMLFKRLFNDIALIGVELPSVFPNIQRIGDFDKIFFFFKLMLLELIKKGATSIKLNFDKDDKEADILNIYFTIEPDEIFECLINEEWQDITDNLYYAYWEFKTSLEILNTKVTCTLCEEKYKISIIFPK